jgi:hypothetical protein
MFKLYKCFQKLPVNENWKMNEDDLTGIMQTPETDCDILRWFGVELHKEKPDAERPVF